MTIHYMPSEIARLVLGYLRETDCKETEKQFIKESKHLTEYALGLRHGINYSTNISGKSLLDVIHDFCCFQNQNNTNETIGRKAVETKSNEEINRLSKQLTKVENILNKLLQNMNSTTVRPNTQNNYRLIASPPILRTSSPLIVSTIQTNSTPIVTKTPNKSTETPNRLTTLLVSDTPSKTEAISPRRKRVPRRRILSGSSPFRSSANSSFDDSSDQTLVNTSASDQLRDDSEAQLRIDINEPLVQPEFIVGELINFEPLHDVLAESINKIFNNHLNSNNDNENCVKTGDQNSHQIQENSDNNENNKRVENIDCQEIRINDIDVNSILTNLESAPEFNTILDIITEKELQMTPYKNVPSIETTNSSSASSLNTPKTPLLRVNAQKVIENPISVVKNLMTELKTPDKTVTLYGARNHSESTVITPVKVAPVKLFRTDLTQDYNFVINDKNLPIIVPKVSVIGDDFSLIQNSIANSLGTYQLTVQSNPNTSQTQYYNSSGTSARKMGGKKRVDFLKPASELQVKRTDLMPAVRKILPKPSTCSTTTVTPVRTDNSPLETTVPKQPLISVNINETESNAKNVNQNDSQSPKRMAANKRPNSGAVESSPIKIKASDVRFPTVNILRKMNVNQFLKQIHSNRDSN